MDITQSLRKQAARASDHKVPPQGLYCYPQLRDKKKVSIADLLSSCVCRKLRLGNIDDEDAENGDGM
jgi:hypothetical protein